MITRSAAGIAILVTLAIALVAIPFAEAAASPLELLRRERRPTVADLVMTIDPTREANPFTPAREDDRVAKIESHAPQLIAALERISPGTTWVLVGRDTSDLADILESFYRSIGQPSRVVRLEASKTTFPADSPLGTSDIPLAYERVLNLHGLVDDLGRPKSPFMILDATSFSLGSQVRMLLAAIYSKQTPAERRALLTKVNAISLAEPANAKQPNGRMIPFGPSIDINAIISSTRVDHIVAGPDRILSVASLGQQFVYVGRLDPTDPDSEELAWSDRFGPVVEVQPGQWRVTPGAANLENQRSHVLWFQFESAARASQPSFLNHVREIARTVYGYDFDRAQSGEIVRPTGYVPPKSEPRGKAQSSFNPMRCLRTLVGR